MCRVGIWRPATSGTDNAHHPDRVAHHNGASPNSYVFLDCDSNIVNGVDTLYIADDGGATVKGIQKWTKGAGGSWTRSTTTLNVSPAVGSRVWPAS